MRDLIVEKGLAQLNHLMMAIQTKEISHDLAMIAIAWMQLISGISTSVFEDVLSLLPHLSPMKWLPSIHNFLNTQQLTLEIQQNFIPKLQQVHGIFLMDSAINA